MIKYTKCTWVFGVLKLKGCCLSPEGASLQLFNFRIPKIHVCLVYNFPHLQYSMLKTLIVYKNLQKSIILAKNPCSIISSVIPLT